MKKYICNPLWLLLLFVAFISSCDKEEIVFDHELPQFELRSDAILLEVIMPQGTGADEIIYIAGDFNGGQDAASGDLKWQMEKAANNDVKWGIYLYPEDFVNGKTLADGFYFVSKTQGIERTLQNGDALHQISAKVGTRTDITVTRWNAYFEEPEDPSEVTHDGYAVFVMDNTGWPWAARCRQWSAPRCRPPAAACKLHHSACSARPCAQCRRHSSRPC